METKRKNIADELATLLISYDYVNSDKDEKITMLLNFIMDCHPLYYYRDFKVN